MATNPPTPDQPAFSIGAVAANSLIDLLQPLIDASASDDAARQVLAAIGWRADALPISLPSIRQAMQSVATSAQAIAAFTTKGSEDYASGLAALIQVMEAAAAVGKAIADISKLASSTSSPPPGLDQLGADLSSWLLDNYLMRLHGFWRSSAALLGLYVPQELAPLHPAVTDSAGNVLRDPYRLPSMQMDHLGTLLSNPGPVLKNAYLPPGALDTPAAIAATADALFPLVADALKALGLDAQYGIDPYWELQFDPDVDAVLEHSLTIWFGEDNVAGVVLAIYPPDSSTNSKPAFVIAPVLPSLDTGLAGWHASLDVATAGGPLSIIDWTATPVDSGSWPGLDVTLTLGWGGDPPVAAAPTAVSPGVKVKVRLAVASTGAVTVSLAVTGYGSLGLSGADFADGFLSQVLPSDGLSVSLQATVAYEQKAWHFAAGTPSAGVFELASSGPVRLGPIQIDAMKVVLKPVPGAAVLIGQSDISVTIGPVSAVIRALGVKVSIASAPGGGNAGPLDIQVGFHFPDGIGLSVDATAITGGGFLFFDETKQEYGGTLDLEFADRFSLKVIAVLDTQNGFSLMGLVFVEDFTPIPLGLGFFLEGVGGMLAINRTAAVDKLRSGLKTGSMKSLLFPEEPVKHAHQIIADLDADFPRADNRYLFGPMAEITWGNPTLVTVKIALLIELPEPVRLILIAQLEALLPDPDAPVVKIHMDALGVINFGTDDLALDAVLYDSKVAAFIVTGAMALRMNWGAQPNFALAVGGFSPAYTPPANFPKVERIVIALAAGDNPRIRLDAYLAITSNTFQMGAHLDLHAAAAGFAIDGHLGFDVLIHFDPFAFIADLHASLSLSYNNSVLMGVDLHLTLKGPSPWEAIGTATFQVFIFSASVSFDVTIGNALPDGPAPSVPDLKSMVITALEDLRNWSAIMPTDSKTAVAVRPRTPVGQQVFVHPLGDLSVHQRAAPLGLSINNYGTIPISTPVTLTIDSVSIANAPDSNAQSIQDFFAPAQFQQLTDDQKLARPSFELYQSGLRFGFSKALGGTVRQSVIGYTTEVVDPNKPAAKAAAVAAAAAAPSGQVLYQVPGDSLLKQIPTGAAARAAGNTTGRAKFAGPVRAVGTEPTTYVLASTSDLTQPKILSDTFVTFSQAADLLRKNRGTFPRLQIVASHEPRRFTLSPLTNLTVGAPSHGPASTPSIRSISQLTIAPNAGISLRALYYRVYAQGSIVPTYTAVALTGITFSVGGPDGTYEVDWFAVDSGGIEEQAHITPVLVDNTPPTASLSVPQTTTGGVQLTLSATDGGSGVASVSYRAFLQGTAVPAYTTVNGSTADIQITGEGTFELDVQATDNVGNVAPQQVSAIQVDTTPPQSTLTVGAPGFPADPQFVTTLSTLIVSATDGGSGVQSVSYRFYPQGKKAPAFTTTPAASVQFTIGGGDGPYQVEPYANDKAGNVETVNVHTITPDTAPPQSQLMVGDPKAVGAATFVAAATQVIINANDGGSGVASLSYRTYATGSPPPAFIVVPAATVTFKLSGADGAHQVDYQATDNLGNAEPMHSDVLYLDTLVPSITITQPTATKYSPSATLVLAYAAVDGAGSGVASLSATMDGSASVAGHGLANGQLIKLTELALGSHVFAVMAVDNVGNATSSSVPFTIS